ncbi:MAG: tRNA (adenosine(37)-N6)-dimethylallyltransferase MiaA [Coriobacteriia bacterium]|nr:tRNA (adenosine(37)-N6)-dimethylallyltransferase MiaA [Coriobacteriia bacterium]
MIAVVGPTAVGKTEFAEKLAVHLGGEIVSADSMQVYRGMDIGTAKPSLESRRVPYHCLDLVDPDVAFSAALYQQAARAAISDIAERGRTPIVVGGTGLYVRAAIDPFDFAPGEAGSIQRLRYEHLAAEQGPGALHALLYERDPESAVRIHANNVRRVVRALELADEGRSYVRQSSRFSERESVYDSTIFGLTMERAALYSRIDARVDRMLADGLVHEFEGLLGEGFAPDLTSMQAIGYKELAPVITQEADMAAAVEAVKLASRRYAKRQLTWFRADPRILWIDVTHRSIDDAVVEALSALDW